MQLLVLQHRKAQQNGIGEDLKWVNLKWLVLNLYIIFLFGLFSYTIVIKASINFAKYESMSFNITGEKKMGYLEVQ